MKDDSLRLETLVSNHRRFVAFLERRLGSADAAEDILQAAYARAVEKGIPAYDDEGSVNWFFAILRNALTDHYRRRAAETRRLDALQSAGVPEISVPELRAEVCTCIRGLMPAMRDEYREILEMVDFDERSVSEVSRELGITTNNASVRLHRARTAARRLLQQTCGVCSEHGCLDCTCRGKISLGYNATSSPRRPRH